MDISKTEIRKIEWQGPFSWTGYENHNKENFEKKYSYCGEKFPYSPHFCGE